MKKLLFVIPLFLMVMNVWAGVLMVPDITKSDKFMISPGVTIFYGNHGCRFNWGGLKRYDVYGFFDGASSFKATYRTVSTGRDCLTLKTDVVNTKVYIPFVNQNALNASITPSELNYGRVTFASTLTKGTIFTLRDHYTEPNELTLTAGVYRTNEYFECNVKRNSLTAKWLKATGIETQITPGYVFTASWVVAGYCADMWMIFDPKLLSEPTQPVDPVIPVQCPVGCTKTP